MIQINYPHIRLFLIKNFPNLLLALNFTTTTKISTNMRTNILITSILLAKLLITSNLNSYVLILTKSEEACQRKYLNSKVGQNVLALKY